MSVEPAKVPKGPVLLCFDGSANAEAAVTRAAVLLAQRDAIVLSVWEPISAWEPHDPGSIVGAGVSRLASKELGVDQIVKEIAEEKLEQGLELAKQAGFKATGRVEEGRAWRAICDVAEELDAATIVLGARGLSRLGSVLIGSVSAAVIAHTRRPVLIIECEPQHDD
ncbi:MAG: universal stress protein [Solirubrobacteraceae bacterium]